MKDGWPLVSTGPPAIEVRAPAVFGDPWGNRSGITVLEELLAPPLFSMALELASPELWVAPLLLPFEAAPADTAAECRLSESSPPSGVGVRGRRC